ncbi:unnamed protein product, partial [Prorocentrum cordatum]
DALARLGLRDAPLAAAAARAVRAHLVELHAEDFAMAVCALARLGCLGTGPACAAISWEARERAGLRLLCARDAARLACAFSLAGVPDAAVYDLLRDCAADQPGRSSSADHLSDQAARTQASPTGPPLDWPVLVINLDR